jgi:hypothetical protein
MALVENDRVVVLRLEFVQVPDIIFLLDLN